MFFIKKFYFTQKWLEHMHISTKSKKKKHLKAKSLLQKLLQMFQVPVQIFFFSY